MDGNAVEKKKPALSFRAVAWLLLAVLLLSLVPILLLGRYDVPSADDFTYGAAAHRSFVETGSLWQTLSAAARRVKESYYGWQGTFSAIFLMALQPAVFDARLYALTPLLILTALILGNLCLCRALLGRLLGMERAVANIVAFVVSILDIQLLPSPVQGMYWYNGAVYYGFFHSLALMSLALGLRTVLDGKTWRVALLCVLAVILGGGNFVTALCCAIVAFAAIFVLLIKKNGAWKRLALPFLLLLAAFAVSALAPGNAMRQAEVDNTPSAIGAILRSFGMAAEYGVSWFSLPLLAALVFLALVFHNAAFGESFSFPFPGLVSLFSYCLFAAMFCPTLYALGTAGDKRLLNMIYYTYVLLLALNLCYWLGWAAKRRKQRNRSDGLPLVPLLLSAVLVMGCCGVFALRHGFTTLMAIGEFRSGEAAEYYACALERETALEDETKRDVALDAYPCQPYLLYFDDITADPSDWRNLAAAAYYDKDSVVLRAGE